MHKSYQYTWDAPESLIISPRPEVMWEEIAMVSALMEPQPDLAVFRDVFDDVVRLFRGEFPGYRRSTTRYHDLDHTLSVVLATARLAQGFLEELDADPDSSGAAERPDARLALTTLAAALFHDSGYLQTSEDHTGTGAKYTITHEVRSIRLMDDVLKRHGFTAQERQDGGAMIEATDMGQRVQEIPFRNVAVKRQAQALGSADLLAQMADRAYLEKLFLLYREFEEAGVGGYASELTLLEQTESFYENTVKTRLAEDMEHAQRWMPLHFARRFGAAVDPYQTSIIKNIEYLRAVLERTRKECREHFRRAGGLE